MHFIHLMFMCLSSKISDKGGGVPLRKIDRLFNYMYSTAPTPRLDSSQAAVPLVNSHHTAYVCVCMCGFMQPVYIVSAGWFWLWAANL